MTPPISSINNTASVAFSGKELHQVSWSPLFWAIVPIMLKSMTQPAGSLIQDMSEEQSFFFRASPVVCVVDGICCLCRFIYYRFILGDFRPATKHLVRMRFKNEKAFDSRLRVFQINALSEAYCFPVGSSLK